MKNPMQKGFLIGAIMGGVAALGWLVGGGQLLHSRMEWKGTAHPVTAVATAHEAVHSTHSDGRQSEAVYTLYSYTHPADGTTRTGKSSVASYPPLAQVGEPIQLLVNPQDENDVRVDCFSELYLLPTGLMALGLVFLIVAGIFLVAYCILRRKQR